MSETRTEDCVAAIVKRAAPSLAGVKWKRNAKYRTNDPTNTLHDKPNGDPDVCWLREFVSSTDSKTSPKIVAYVWASEEIIVQVKILDVMTDATVVLFKDGNEWRLSDESDPTKHSFPVTVPQFLCVDAMGEEGDPKIWEEQDFENYEIRSVNGGEVEIWHGGDWQEPQTSVYRLMSDGKLYYKP